MPTPSKRTLSFGFHHCTLISFLPRVPHAQPIPFSWISAQIVKVLVTKVSLSSRYYFLPLGSKYLPQHPVLEHPRPIFVS